MYKRQALGWATYGGDQLSMYAVNASVPKTLVRHLVAFAADRAGGECAAALRDILATPVSPELLPAGAGGEIAQRTESLVGPYRLHDFFLYHALRCGEPPRKVYRLACIAFAGAFSAEAVSYTHLDVYKRQVLTSSISQSMPVVFCSSAR